MMWVVTKKYITDPDKVDGDEPQYIPEDLLGDPANEQKNFRYSINGRPRGVAGTVLKIMKQAEFRGGVNLECDTGMIQF